MPKTYTLINTGFYLARAYRLQENIDSSLIILETLKTETLNAQFLESVDKELELTKKSVSNLFSVSDLDSVINSSFSEHSPVYSQSENILIFTSRRFNSNSIRYDDGQYDEDIYYSKRINGAWSQPILMSNFSSDANEASSCLSVGGNELVLYKDDSNGSIYTSMYKEGNWSTPEKMPSPINSRHRETHASLTADGNTIFFTSDRPGGYGGLDIWMSKKVNGVWQKPINLGLGVNSKEDEESPNISADGKTLYFSSNGRSGYGGFDIFKSPITDFGTWGMAENLGYPVNSIGDDIFFSPIASTDKAFYTSYRSGTKGNADIFVVYLDSTSVNTKTVNFGYLFDEDNNPVNNAEIIIQNNDTQQKFLAKPTPKGKFIFITEPNTSYTITVQRNNMVLYTDVISMPDSIPKELFYKNIILKNL